MTILTEFSDFWKVFRFFESVQIFWKFLWPETWHLRHWLHFWQLRTTIWTIALWPLNTEWWWQHSQFLRCYLLLMFLSVISFIILIFAFIIVFGQPSAPHLRQDPVWPRQRGGSWPLQSSCCQPPRTGGSSHHSPLSPTCWDRRPCSEAGVPGLRGSLVGRRGSIIDTHNAVRPPREV